MFQTDGIPFTLLCLAVMGAMETPQHGIRPKKTETSPKWIFPVFSKTIGNPSNPIFRGISCFFDPFPQFLGRIPVYTGLIFLRDFLIYSRDFPIFSIQFLIFWVHFRFSVKVLNSQFVDRFPLFFGPFPLFWSISTFFGSIKW